MTPKLAIISQKCAKMTPTFCGFNQNSIIPCILHQERAKILRFSVNSISISRICLLIMISISDIKYKLATKSKIHFWIAYFSWNQITSLLFRERETWKSISRIFLCIWKYVCTRVSDSSRNSWSSNIEYFLKKYSNNSSIWNSTNVRISYFSVKMTPIWRVFFLHNLFEITRENNIQCNLQSLSMIVLRVC